MRDEKLTRVRAQKMDAIEYQVNDFADIEFQRKDLDLILDKLFGLDRFTFTSNQLSDGKNRRKPNSP